MATRLGGKLHRGVGMDRKLIDQHIEQNPHRPGVSEARLVGYCVPVWAIIGYFEAVHGDEGRTAEDYDVPIEAVQAAVAYYKLHKTRIDARPAANAA